MGVDDDLSQRVLISWPLLRVHGDRLKEPEHRGNPLRMDAVLRLFQTENSPGVGLLLDDRERKKSKRAVRKGACRVFGAVAKMRHKCQQLTLVVSVHSNILDVINEVG